jgi:hypothetical protein
MVLSRWPVDVSTLNLDGARRELESLIRTSSDGISRQWGYFPDLDPDPAHYRQSRQLGHELAQLIPTFIDAPPLRLAFVRLALGRPRSEFGGLHVDVHAGIRHDWPDDVPRESQILRLLINVGQSPRRVEYCPLTIEMLRQRHGMEISGHRYEVLQLPAGVPLCHVDIPAAGAAIWCLRFVSSIVPHAGRTDDQGHFLASFGGYLPPGRPMTT